MSIIVVCPGCRKSFKVSDKFAGKSGPCPSCKRTLQVPTKEQEVQVHAPEAFAGGGKSAEGKLITKPIARVNAKFQPVTMAIIGAAVVGVLVVTFIGGRAGLFGNLFVTAVGLLLVSPPLVLAAYEILRDVELEPYRGTALYVRSAACALGYVVLWGMFALLSSRGIVTGELWNWIFIAVPFVVVGGMAAMGAFDLEFGDGVFHFCFYLVATLVLRWAAGMQWIWNVTQ